MMTRLKWIEIFIKIKSLLTVVTMLAAGGIVGMVMVWGGLVMWQCHAPYDDYKWSATLQAITGRPADDTASSFDPIYYAIHTLKNGGQIREKINPLEFATRSQKSAANDIYVMRDGIVRECGENSMRIKHSSISEMFYRNLEFNRPCQVGMKIEGGHLLGSTISANTPSEAQ